MQYLLRNIHVVFVRRHHHAPRGCSELVEKSRTTTINAVTWQHQHHIAATALDDHRLRGHGGGIRAPGRRRW